MDNHDNITQGEKRLEDVYLEDVLSHFEGSIESPSMFFKQHTWILYTYIGISIHGFVMNSFLV